MNKKTITLVLNLILSFSVFTLVWAVLKFVIKIESNVMLLMVTAVLTKIICPTIKAFETQSVEQLQLKSIFSKKVYLIN